MSCQGRGQAKESFGVMTMGNIYQRRSVTVITEIPLDFDTNTAGSGGKFRDRALHQKMQGGATVPVARARDFKIHGLTPSGRL